MNIIELQKTNGISICSMEKICTVGTVVAGYGTEPTQPVRNLELNQIEDYSDTTQPTSQSITTH